jgi:hypothetical protein
MNIILAGELDLTPERRISVPGPEILYAPWTEPRVARILHVKHSGRPEVSDGAGRGTAAA